MFQEFSLKTGSQISYSFSSSSLNLFRSLFSGDSQVSMWISCRHYMETILHEMNSLPELWSSFQSHVVIVGSPSFPNRHWMHRANCTSWSPQHLGRPADSLSRASLTELEPAMTMQQYYNSAYFITRPSMTGQRHEEKFPVKIQGRYSLT